MLNVHIEFHEIMNAIDQLLVNKSSCPDSIIGLNEFLVSGKHSLSIFMYTV